MRFLLPDQLGNNKHPQMFHSSGFAIAAGVVAVGAAAGSAAISMSAADRAKKAQGAASKKFQKQQRKASQAFEQSQEKALGDYRGAVTSYQESERLPYQMIQDVQAPEYNLGAMMGDAGQITDYNIQQGQKISDYYRQQLEAFQPGAAALRARSVEQLNKGMDVTDQYLRGEIPQDVREQTMRNIAEFGGAGFNPATAGRAGGFQTAQALVPRQFGLTSLDLQGRGLGAIPSIQGTAQNWQQLARAFTADVQAASPLDVGRLQLGYQTAAAEVGLQKGRALSGINQGIFGASTNLYNAQQDVSKNIFAANSGLADKIYGAQKENIAASYAAQQAVGQGVSDIGQATSGALMGMSGAGSGMGGMMGGGGGSSSNPYYGSLTSTPSYGSSNYVRAVSNPNTQYLGGQSRLDTRTDY
jgi:hypothetical protein